jgi:hypothetical protein
MITDLLLKISIPYHNEFNYSVYNSFSISVKYKSELKIHKEKSDSKLSHPKSNVKVA